MDCAVVPKPPQKFPPPPRNEKSSKIKIQKIHHFLLTGPYFYMSRLKENFPH